MIMIRICYKPIERVPSTPGTVRRLGGVGLTTTTSTRNSLPGRTDTVGRRGRRFRDRIGCRPTRGRASPRSWSDQIIYTWCIRVPIPRPTSPPPPSFPADRYRGIGNLQTWPDVIVPSCTMMLLVACGKTTHACRTLCRLHVVFTRTFPLNDQCIK